MNKQYWKNFYNKNPELSKNSSFSEFVLKYLSPQDNLLDLGCGNGKDTYFFLKNGIKAIGIDNNEALSGENFIVGDVLSSLQKCENYYLRFFAHAVEEEYLDSLIEKIHNISETGSRIFIETRSTKGVTTDDRLLLNFKSGIGEEHHRMLYSCSYLEAKMKEKFKVFYLEESYGLSPFAGKDPCLIRICCIKE
jgi:tellurite methyltransferase